MIRPVSFEQANDFNLNLIQTFIKNIYINVAARSDLGVQALFANCLSPIKWPVFTTYTEHRALTRDHR